MLNLLKGKSINQVTPDRRGCIYVSFLNCCVTEKNILSLTEYQNQDKITRYQSAANAKVFSLPNVGQHKQQGTDDDSLKYLPVATEVRHSRHQEPTTQNHKAGHHGHGKSPSWQAQLNPWQRERRKGKKVQCVFFLVETYLEK